MFSYPSVLTYVLDAQNKHIIEYPHHMIWLRIKKKTYEPWHVISNNVAFWHV